MTSNAVIEVRLDADGLQESFGVTDFALARKLLLDTQVSQALSSRRDSEEMQAGIDAALAAIASFQPRDTIEAHLVVQMIGTHNVAMECIRRSNMDGPAGAGREANLKQATKFLALYYEQMKALNKHRGKGDQRVTIEHVHIASGSQAIVGGAQSTPRPEGGGADWAQWDSGRESGSRKSGGTKAAAGVPAAADRESGKPANGPRHRTRLRPLPAPPV